MCGIFALIENGRVEDEKLTGIVENASKLLYHRGPDSNNYTKMYDSNYNKTVVLVHTRLKINGDDSKQPLIGDDGSIQLVINGEIFNWKELSKELGYTCKNSDCDIIIPLYEKYIRLNNDYHSFFEKLDGQFSFVLYDLKYSTIFVSRDHVGVTPLYYGFNTNEENPSVFDRIVFSSEMKCLSMQVENRGFVNSIKSFYPRRYIYENLSNLGTSLSTVYTYLDFYKKYQYDNCSTPGVKRESVLEMVRQKLTNGVRKQLEDIDGNVDFGVLLSGGLDSSLIASIVSRLSKTKVKTFSVGINKNSVDLVAARKVAEFLGTEHYEYTFSIEEGLDNIKNVIWYTESYDTTTVRASTAMYLLTKKIKENFPSIKVLFSGELSDELLCYLYGSNAPSTSEFQLETLRLVSNVHLFDCLRANKTSMANSMEVRVPFTDREFMEYILSLDPKYKIFGKLASVSSVENSNGTEIIEKKILRDSFIGFLPNEILYRKKEQFSDGVSATFDKSNDGVIDTSGNWVESIKNHCDQIYDEISFNILSHKYNYNKPATKEQLYYREIFCYLFNNCGSVTGMSFKNTSEFTVKFWEPKWSVTNDPSAREYAKNSFTPTLLQRLAQNQK
jgi:asparagine synthase (glutamine-hydrolysing)